MATKMMQDQRGWFARLHDDGRIDNLSNDEPASVLVLPLQEITSPRMLLVAQTLDTGRAYN